jgi:hypothetical protein
MLTASARHSSRLLVSYRLSGLRVSLLLLSHEATPDARSHTIIHPSIPASKRTTTTTTRTVSQAESERAEEEEAASPPVQLALHAIKKPSEEREPA